MGMLLVPHSLLFFRKSNHFTFNHFSAALVITSLIINNKRSDRFPPCLTPPSHPESNDFPAIVKVDLRVWN